MQAREFVPKLSTATYVGTREGARMISTMAHGFVAPGAPMVPPIHESLAEVYTLGSMQFQIIITEIVIDEECCK